MSSLKVFKYEKLLINFKVFKWLKIPEANKLLVKDIWLLRSGRYSSHKFIMNIVWCLILN